MFVCDGKLPVPVEIIAFFPLMISMLMTYEKILRTIGYINVKNQLQVDKTGRFLRYTYC